MNAANPKKSQRLKRVLSVLNDGCEHSTRDLIHAAEVCAVNSIIAELRCNGHDIECRRVEDIWYYRLIGQPPTAQSDEPPLPLDVSKAWTKVAAKIEDPKATLGMLNGVILRFNKAANKHNLPTTTVKKAQAGWQPSAAKLIPATEASS